MVSELFPFRAFLSHSSEDGALAKSMQQHVRAIGVELYLAEHDPQPGKQLSMKIRRAIERSHVVLVLLTKAGVASPYVQQEIGYALRCDLPVIPLVERGVPLEKLAMLQGLEYIEVDPSNPDTALHDSSKYLGRLKEKRDRTDAVAFIVIGALIFLWGTGKGGPPAPSV